MRVIPSSSHRESPSASALLVASSAATLLVESGTTTAEAAFARDLDDAQRPDFVAPSIVALAEVLRSAIDEDAGGKRTGA